MMIYAPSHKLKDDLPYEEMNEVRTHAYKAEEMSHNCHYYFNFLGREDHL